MSTLAAVHQTDAPAYFFGGVLMKVHLTGAQTGGAFSMLEAVSPAGHRTPPHVHQHEDEAFFVLEGEIDIIVGGKTMTVRPGESAFAPRGVPHQLQNNSGRPARGIVVATSSGFAEFVAAAGVPAHDGPPPAPEPEQFMQIAERFGISLAA
jgi:quercetin dioxygenase-like cupin family protein